MGVLIVGVMASHLPPNLAFARLAPGSVLIAVLWAAGLVLIGRARNGLPWQASGDAPNGQDAPRGHSQKKVAQTHHEAGGGLLKPAVVFGIGAVVTLGAGVLLEQSGEAIASKLGMSGVLFGATVLAAATSLPEVSTGLASVRLGDVKLAVSDIFGGNAFLPVLFLPAELIVGKPVLPRAQATDIYLAALGVLLTCVYLYGLVFRPKRKLLGMGSDSLAVLVLYGLGLAGLFAIASQR